MAEKPEKQRVFLAFWPGDAERRALAAVAVECAERAGGRPVRPENLHLTLAFLGDLHTAQLQAVRELAASLAAPQFTLVLDRIGFWLRQRIVWAGCRQAPEALGVYVGHLRAALQRLGFRVDPRPYAPHLTLVRRARRAPRVRMSPVSWSIESFCLVRSSLMAEGARYDILSRWPDRPPGTP